VDTQSAVVANRCFDSFTIINCFSLQGSNAHSNAAKDGPKPVQMQKGEQAIDALQISDCIATAQGEKQMNATAITFPSWTADIQHYSQKVIFYTPIVWNAFNKTLAPVILDTLKGISLHCIERERLWREWTLNIAGITHNPLQSSFKAAIAELTSTESQATYSRIRSIIREAATDALVIGLCGVVAIAEGVELAQKVYRQAKAAYAWVNAKLNPVRPGPMILPTVKMAIALQQEPLADIQALIAEDEEYERQFMAKLERLDDVAVQPSQTEVDLWDGGVDYEPVEFSPCSEFVPLSDSVLALAPAYVPVVGEITSPEPTDMHRENARMVAPAKAEDELVSGLEVPGAKGPNKRTTKATAAKKPSKGKDQATTSAPKRRRAAAK
jgi:hypothetical protein